MFNWLTARTCVYDWSCWKGTLIANVVADARRIRARIAESPQALANRLPRRVDRFIVHLDISENTPFVADPAELVRVLTARGVEVLNAFGHDIRKRTIQACCHSYGLPSLAAAMAGDGDERLIVKTDLNSGGSREQLLSPQQRERFKLPARPSLLKGPSGYFVARRSEIGAEVWADPDLVVERYVANPLGRFFRLYVAGNAVVLSEAYDQVLVKRMGGQERRYNYRLWREGPTLRQLDADGQKLPAGLLRTAGVFADRFRLDFGAIDIVESDADEYFVVDVNKTPYWGTERQPGLLEHLTPGLG